MNVGLDIGGTISELPEFFVALTKGLHALGHKVYILSFESPLGLSEVRQDLDQWGICYDEVLLLPDDADSATWKGEVAGQLPLDVMVDDTLDLLQNMPPGVKCFWLRNGSGPDQDASG